MPGGYSRKFEKNGKRMGNSNFCRDNLGEQKILESASFRVSKSLKSKRLATMVCYLRVILGLLQTSCFELLGGWSV